MGPDRPSDDLEHWLSDLRAEASNAPADWLTDESVDEQTDQTVEHSPPAPGPRGTDAAKPSGGGRHRAPD
ncbi:hypothetical protein ACWEOZ_28840 [Actinoplanes sp. NPDC004185]